MKYKIKFKKPWALKMALEEMTNWSVSGQVLVSFSSGTIETNDANAVDVVTETFIKHKDLYSISTAKRTTVKEAK